VIDTSVFHCIPTLNKRSGLAQAAGGPKAEVSKSDFWQNASPVRDDASTACPADSLPVHIKIFVFETVKDRSMPAKDNCLCQSNGDEPMSEMRIRPMRPDEIAIAIDWAAAEGWNPGLGDAACFATVDEGGFLIGEIDGKPAATISCVNYDPHFSFLGFYIVRNDLRGRGYGLQIWKAAIAHAGARVIGLDGVVTQQDNYRKSGFSLAYPNIRYGGKVMAPPTPQESVVDLADVRPADLETSDSAVFPAPRAAFLRSWVRAAGHFGRARIRDGALAAWGVIRPCRTGSKIGPLVAEDRRSAEAVLSGLLQDSGADDVFLDVPGVNTHAAALATELGLAPVFETARMYTAPIKPLALHRVFGVTTFELG